MRIITDFHGEDAAEQAHRRVRARLRSGNGGAGGGPRAPDRRRRTGRCSCPSSSSTMGLATSNCEAMRLIAQRGVHVDEPRCRRDRTIPAVPGATHLIKVGKRRFGRVVFE